MHSIQPLFLRRLIRVVVLRPGILAEMLQTVQLVEDTQTGNVLILRAGDRDGVCVDAVEIGFGDGNVHV